MNETSLADSLVAIDGNVTAATQLLLSMGLLEQLALLRSLTPRLDARGSGGRGQSDYWVSTVAGAALVSLGGTITSAGGPSLRLDLLNGRAHWKATFYPSALARPTRIAKFDDTGGTTWPETYESASRVVWRQLASAMRDGRPLAYTLADLADDLELAQAFGRSGTSREKEDG
jgi:hypothetical protein